MLIVPAIIPKNYKEIEINVSLVKDLVSLVQVDISDGIFSKNKTWPFLNDLDFLDRLSFEELALPFWQDVEYEIHLMIENPELSIEKWINLSPKNIIFHIEATKNIEDIILFLKEKEIGVGLAVKPETLNEKIIPFIDRIDFLQIMGSNKLGFSGLKIEESVFEKIRYFKQSFQGLEIAVDIGVNRETAGLLKEAGATKLISNSSIFENKNI